MQFYMLNNMAGNMISAYYSKGCDTKGIPFGYLCYNNEDETCHIPNTEVRTEWINAIEDDANYNDMMSLANTLCWHQLR